MVVVISGATKGVGRALAMYFAKQGYNLALGARSLDALELLKKELISSYKVKVFVKSCDFSHKEETVLFSNEVLKQFKVVDVLVNNVGLYKEDTVNDEVNDFDLVMRTNLNSAYYLTKAISKNMKENGAGHIFNICSVLSHTVRPTAASYTISKHALKGFNDVLREDMREHEVKVTAIYPGAINTSSWDGIEVPKEEFIQPNDIVEIINSCLSMSAKTNIEEVFVRPINKNH